MADTDISNRYIWLYWAANDSLTDEAMPIPGRKTTPDWLRFLDMDIDGEPTARKCLPFNEGFKLGYSIPYPSDLRVSTNNSTLKTVETETDKFTIEPLSQSATERNTTPTTTATTTPEPNAIIHTPWYITTPPNYDVMLMPPSTQFNHPVSLYGTRLSPDTTPTQISFPVHIDTDPFTEYTVSGERMVKVIPIARNDADFSITQTPMRNIAAENKEFFNESVDVEAYKKLMGERPRKTYRRVWSPKETKYVYRDENTSVPSLTMDQPPVSKTPTHTVVTTPELSDDVDTSELYTRDWQPDWLRNRLANDNTNSNSSVWTNVQAATNSGITSSFSGDGFSVTIDGTINEEFTDYYGVELTNLPEIDALPLDVKRLKVITLNHLFSTADGYSTIFMPTPTVSYSNMIVPYGFPDTDDYLTQLITISFALQQRTIQFSPGSKLHTLLPVARDNIIPSLVVSQSQKHPP